MIETDEQDPTALVNKYESKFNRALFQVYLAYGTRIATNVLIVASCVYAVLLTMTLVAARETLYNYTGEFEVWATLAKENPAIILGLLAFAIGALTVLNCRANRVLRTAELLFLSTLGIAQDAREKAERSGAAPENLMAESLVVLLPRLARIEKNFRESGNYTTAVMREEHPKGVVQSREELAESYDLTRITNLFTDGLLCVFIAVPVAGLFVQIKPMLAILSAHFLGT